MAMATSTVAEIDFPQLDALEKVGLIESNASVLLILPDKDSEPSSAKYLAGHFATEMKVFIASSQELHPTQILETALAISRNLQLVHQVKRVNVLGIGSGAQLALVLASLFPKLVRRVILRDASSSALPSIFKRIIGKIEQLFPAGFPLRSSQNNFDVRSALHRVRCPALILVSQTANSRLKNEARFIAKKIPNAWLETKSNAFESSVSAFLTIPVKSAQ